MIKPSAWPGTFMSPTPHPRTLPKCLLWCLVSFLLMFYSLALLNYLSFFYSAVAFFQAFTLFLMPFSLPSFILDTVPLPSRVICSCLVFPATYAQNCNFFLLFLCLSYKYWDITQRQYHIFLIYLKACYFIDVSYSCYKT